jgi:hypothetical protein
MTFLVEHAFAGIWSLVWQWGIGIGLIILCFAGAWFLPLWRKDFIYAAALVFVALFFMGVGINQWKKHVVAQQEALDTQVNKVVNGTTTEKSKAAKDRYDNKNY